ncbi:MAG TPA: cbb3-type cytochrome c oxidase N-terminal domain-containing protein [Planctomycetaceae bacterium]
MAVNDDGRPDGRGPDDGSLPDDPLTGHCYDGIQEYDNPLPGWWSWLFLGTVAFSVVYWAYYHFGMPGRTLAAAYDRALSENLRLQFAELGELRADREVILKYSGDKKWLAVGKTAFEANCVSCHGPKGEGLVGPNLTDDHWKHVRQPEDIATVIAAGAASGAMPAWKNRLHPNEVVLIASYLVSLRGSMPEGSGKPPEGPAVPPWDAAPAEEPQQAAADDRRRSG